MRAFALALVVSPAFAPIGAIAAPVTTALTAFDGGTILVDRDEQVTVTISSPILETDKAGNVVSTTTKTVIFDQFSVLAPTKATGKLSFSGVLDGQFISGEITLSAGYDANDNVWVLVRFAQPNNGQDDSSDDKAYASVTLGLQDAATLVGAMLNRRAGTFQPSIVENDGPPLSLTLLRVCGCVGWFYPDIICGGTGCGMLCPRSTTSWCRWYLIVIIETPLDKGP